jgi:hypothetical protein
MKGEPHSAPQLHDSYDQCCALQPLQCSYNGFLHHKQHKAICKLAQSLK